MFDKHIKVKVNKLNYWTIKRRGQCRVALRCPEPAIEVVLEQNY